MAEKKKVYTIEYDRIQKGVYAMSFVDFPAIEENFIHLKKLQMRKTVDERHMVYGPALIPDKLILRVDEQTGEEYYIKFEADTIEKLSHDFFRKDHQHDFTYMHQEPIDGVSVVQSWIKHYDVDQSVALGFDLPIGTWFIGAYVSNPDVWEKVKAGEVRGFSVEALTGIVPANLMIQNLLTEIEQAILAAQ